MSHSGEEIEPLVAMSDGRDSVQGAQGYHEVDRESGSRLSYTSSAERARQRKARLAALQQEEIFVHQEAELERSRLANELATRQVRLAKEIAILRAEEAVYEENDDPEISFKSPLLAQPTTGTGAHSTPLPVVASNVNSTRPLSQNRNIRVDLPVITSDVSMSGIHAIPVTAFPPHSTSSHPSTLESVLRQNQLPKLEMKTFRDDPLDFQHWLVSFEKLIEEVTQDPVKRLHYLSQYTDGQANVLVSGHILGQTEQDYQDAKAELKKEYGNPYILARTYIQKIERWQIIKANDGEALNALATFLKKCRGSMPSLHHLQQLNTDLYLQKIVAKLPYAVQGNWRQAVSRSEEKGEDVNFNKLVTFVGQQAQTAKHPVFSVEALAGLEGKVKPQEDGPSSTRYKGHTKIKSVSMATSVTEPKHLAPNSSSSSVDMFCVMCNRNNHDLDACRKYLSKTLPERKEFLVGKKLCFSC